VSRRWVCFGEPPVRALAIAEARDEPAEEVEALQWLGRAGDAE